MIMELIVVVLPFVAISLVFLLSQAAQDECLSVPLIKNFNMEAILGKWYAHEVGDEDEGSKKCLFYTLTSSKGKNGAATTVQRSFVKSGSKKVETYKGYHVGNTSEFIVEWKGLFRKGWVIATKYDSWSTWYICAPYENKGTVAVLTRDKQPSSEVVEDAHKYARSIGFKVTKPYLKEIDQSICE